MRPNLLALNNRRTDACGLIHVSRTCRERTETTELRGKARYCVEKRYKAPRQPLEVDKFNRINNLVMVDRAGFEPAYACTGRFTVCCL